MPTYHREFTKSFKISPADDQSLIVHDFNRNKGHIYINDKLLEEMFTEITADNLDRVWNKLFVGAGKEELIHWKDFATKYLHQGGFMYPLQSIVAGCLAMPNLGYSTAFAQKELHFTFNKNDLQIKENFTYTNLLNPDDSLTLKAKEGSYLFRGELSHSVFVDINDKKIANFQHTIAEVKLDYKEPKLKTHLDERSVIKKIKDLFKDFFKDLIPSLNNYAFFKTVYKGNFCLSESKKIEGTEYIRVTK
ncbi:hypothetical protein [Rickettsiella endosymbiont of Rhagonycha lignosa]|uniref:hypothetical protein n=1 Tax=Rickettsiella endosymbiont of Rhagonycha lignosa TaxID=3077937 RepID=UPI00313B76D5